MSNDQDSTLSSSATWKPVGASVITGSVVAGLSMVVRVSLLHDVSALEDAILRWLLEHGVSIALDPMFTELIVGSVEVLWFAALGVIIGLGTEALRLRWPASFAVCLTLVVAASAQILMGLLPRGSI